MTVKGSKGLTQAERSAQSGRLLLKAAVELIVEKGYAKTTASEIGVRAGYSRMMVHSRYGSKDALLETLLVQEYEPLLLVSEDAPSGLERFLAPLTRLSQAPAEDESLVRGLFAICFETVGSTAQLRGWMADWLARYHVGLTASLREGQADGSVRDDVDVEAEARASMSQGLGIGFRWTLQPDLVDFEDEVLRWRDQARERLAP